MALVKGPLGGIAASGKIGGQVYARNRAGQYSRAWAKPINPVTTRQAHVRSMFGAASTHWGMLDGADVDAWNAYAALLIRNNALGEPYTPNGRQVFMEINNNLQNAGQPVMTVPSAFTDKPAWGHIAFSGTSPGSTADVIDTFAFATVTDVVVPSGGIGQAIVEATAPLDPKITNPNNFYRYILSDDSANFAPLTSYVTEYNDIFGSYPAPVDKIIWVRARIIDVGSGLSSPYVYVNGAVQ